MKNGVVRKSGIEDGEQREKETIEDHWIDGIEDVVVDIDEGVVFW